jgi:SAM-dependent methyltransferase
MDIWSARQHPVQCSCYQNQTATPPHAYLSHPDLQHHLWRLSLDGALYLSPLPPSTNSVLDLGTGTGIWAIEFADENPSATVTGVDLSPVQPRWIPPNCQFQVDDVEAEWTYPPPPPDPSQGGGGGFDFIHSRMLSLGLKDWPNLFRQSFTHLRPGGYFEAQEFDLTIRCEPDSPKQGVAFRKWSEALTRAARKAGINAQASLKFDQQLRDAGFTDVQCKHFRWPVGPWADDSKKKEKALGIWAQRNMLDGLEAAAMGLLSRYEGWSQEQVLELVGEAREEIGDMGFHQYADL